MHRVRRFISQFPLQTFARNETILLKNEQPETIYAVKSGFVKGYDIDANGSEQLVWLGANSDFFPIAWAFSLSPDSQYFYSAFTEVELYRINRETFLEFLNKNHTALLEVTNRLAKRFSDAMHHLNAAEKAKAEDKIVHTLYFLSLRFGHFDGDPEATEVKLPITHQDIANLLGLTRETVTVELKKLKDAGYIDYDKSRFTVYQDKLEALL